MKCLRLALAACAAAVSFHGIAHAADPYQPAPVVVEEAPYEDTLGFYLRGDIGWSFLEWSGGKDDNAFTGGGGVGYQFTQNLRGDVRVDWSGDYDIGPNADLSTTTLLGNMYFDIPTETIFTPYVGGGAGWGWASVDGRQYRVAGDMRRLENDARQAANDVAKKVIATAIQRFAGEFVSEKTVSVVELPSDEMKGRIIGREAQYPSY